MASDNNTATDWWTSRTGKPSQLPAGVDPVANPPAQSPAPTDSQQPSFNPIAGAVVNMLARMYGQQQQQSQPDPNQRRPQVNYQDKNGNWHTRVDARLLPSPANRAPFSPMETPGLDSWKAMNPGAPKQFAAATVSVQNPVRVPSSIIPPAPSAPVSLPASVSKGVSAPITGEFKSGVYTGFKTPYGTVASRSETEDERMARSTSTTTRRIASR